MTRGSESHEDVIVALGSNLGDRLAYLLEGLEGLASAVRLLRVSSVVETPPAGFLGQGPFLNLVVRGRTRLTPHALLRHLQRVERASGRVRSVPGGPRTLDADLVFHGDRVIRTSRLTVPHPRWADRSFVVVPLLEVDPDRRDPVTGRPVREVATPEALTGPLERWGPPPSIPSRASQQAGAGP
jgi:2-amino-4-hydroxy-6-hydroxymethyldihydropteridine diphosphokinase